MPSPLRTIRRTAVAAALVLAVTGAGASSAFADSPAPTGAPSVERSVGDKLDPATAKQKREIRRQAKHADRTGAVTQARTTKPGAKKQSRWYTPLGCIYFSDASICGYDTYFDVSYVINWYSGGTSLGFMPSSWWNTLVYYYA